MSATTSTRQQSKPRSARLTQRPEDIDASRIRFGIEIETKIPYAAAIAVGGYHAGEPVFAGFDVAGNRLAAPTFQGETWRADSDASITREPGEVACEFVSPILHGVEGVEALCQFIDWLNAIGATVDTSCGVHITVGIESVIGSSQPEDVSAFVRKLAHIAQWHAMSLYGQTGTGRHLNRYSHTLAADVEHHLRRIVNTSSIEKKNAAAEACGRGMLNVRKAFRMRGSAYVGAVEFRVFAGTTSMTKILHHLGTVLGLCRRAHQVQCLGGFRKNKLQAQRTSNAVSALAFLHDYLGWTGSTRPVALGLFGRLHSAMPACMEDARRLCAKFDEHYPDARL